MSRDDQVSRSAGGERSSCGSTHLSVLARLDHHLHMRARTKGEILGTVADLVGASTVALVSEGLSPTPGISGARDA